MEISAETYRLLVESVQDYAIYVLAPDGTIQSWNTGAQRLKGYAASEVVGQSFEMFFSPEDRAADKPKALMKRALATGRTEDVGWRFRKDGSQFWASAVMTVLRDEAGHHVGFAKVTRDLTDRAYRAFVEAAHAIVWTTDANGRPNADSVSWRAFTGQTEQEWLAQRAWDPVHPDDQPAMRDAWTAAKQQATRFESQFRLRRSDGVYVWMEVRAVPLLGADNQVREWFGVTFDASARKHAELQTQRALELWRTTLRSIGDGVVSTDTTGRVRFMNPVAERLTGWTSAEAEGKPLTEVFPIFNEESGAVVENPVAKVLREGLVVGLANHTVLKRRDGVITPIADSAAPIRDPSGTVDGVVLVFRDATEEKQELVRRSYLAKATEQLLEATDYNAALARVAQLAVPELADWAAVDILDDAAGQTQRLAVAHVDPAKIEYARELARRYPPDPDAETGVPNVLRTGRAEFYPEIPTELLERGAIDEDHLTIIRELDLRSALVVPLRGRGLVFGAITYVLAGSDRRYTERDLALAEDLARRAALIIERRRLEEQAEAANRMKDDFLATVSHELRTPLQAILGYASTLQRGIARDPQKAIEAILRSAAAQARLVDDILDVSRITSGKLRLAIAEIDLAAAIRAALDAIRPAAQGRRITLVEDLRANLGKLHGDFDRVQQIVWNLLSNAVKFTEPGGTVEVRAETAGDVARIVVRDTGRGIPPEHLSTIFERFRQLDGSTTRQRGGLGLGLAIVRYLVEAHGGTVQAESDGDGRGSKFIVELPTNLQPTVAAGAPGASAPAMARPLHGVRIVVVDDDDDARELMADVLADAGATVAKARSAGDAFAAVQAQPPDLVVSDIGMPGEDGYSLLRRIRALPAGSGGNVPAIALTAYARPEDVRAAMDAGFQVHLAKPIRPDALVDAVAAWARPASVRD